VRSVPRIARWLLKHFGSSPNNDAIIGDIAEQYSQGHSRAWYWRQVCVAIVMGLVNECRGHKWITARALLIGWTLLFFSPSPFNFLLRDLLFAFASWSRWWRQAWILPLTFTLYAAFFFMISGWLIARLHRPHQVSMVLIFALSSCCVVWPMFFPHIAEGTRWWPVYVMPIIVPTSILLGGGLLTRPA
jgi:hypothetical protein